jgi:hypothetical protein
MLVLIWQSGLIGGTRQLKAKIIKNGFDRCARQIEPYSSTVGPGSNSNNSHGVVAEEGMAFFEKRSRGFHRKIFGFFT